MKSIPKPSLSSNQRGFTLVELMMTIVVAAVLAGIAAPNMRSFILNNRLSGTANELLRSIQSARSEATKRQNNIVICMTDKAASDPTNATCATTGLTGWITFIDFDNDWDRDVGEDIFEVHTFESSKMHLVADNSKKISFASSGFANPAGSTPLTQTASTAMVICDSRGNVTAGGQSTARGLSILATGRARMTRVTSEVASLLTTIGSACPP